MCGGLHTATGCLRFDSFLTQDNVVIMLIYEVSSILPVPPVMSPGGSSVHACPVPFKQDSACMPCAIEVILRMHALCYCSNTPHAL